MVFCIKLEVWGGVLFPPFPLHIQFLGLYIICSLYKGGGQIVVSWTENYGHCNSAGSNITVKMAAKQLKDFYGKNKTKWNILNSSLPRTSAAMLLNYWKLTRSFSLIAFHKQMLLALLFVLFIFQAPFIPSYNTLYSRRLRASKQEFDESYLAT